MTFPTLRNCPRLNLPLSASAHRVDQREDADSSGHVVRRGPEPPQQMAEASGLHGRAGVQQGLADQSRPGRSSAGRDVTVHRLPLKEKSRRVTTIPAARLTIAALLFRLVTATTRCHCYYLFSSSANGPNDEVVNFYNIFFLRHYIFFPVRVILETSSCLSACFLGAGRSGAHGVQAGV